MAVVVWKYTFSQDLPSISTFSMPIGAKILCVKMMPNGIISMWALVNKSETNLEERKFLLVGTGHTIKDQPDSVGLTYIGTVLDTYQAEHNWIENPPVFVWHIFEVVK